jgi:integrase
MVRPGEIHTREFPGLLHVAGHENFVPKDGDNRTIPITDRFATFLKAYLAGREKGQYVLAPEKTVKPESKYRYDVDKRVRSHFTRCNVNASFHDMRRSFGSNRASDNVSIYKIAAWLGDTIEVVTRSYGHLIPRITRSIRAYDPRTVSQMPQRQLAGRCPDRSIYRLFG